MRAQGASEGKNFEGKPTLSKTDSSSCFGIHSDEEALLLEQGSSQSNLWGVNLYPDKSGNDFIEFDSVINLRPSQGNRSRDVIDPQIREKIKEIIAQLVGE